VFPAANTAVQDAGPHPTFSAVESRKSDFIFFIAQSKRRNTSYFQHGPGLAGDRAAPEGAGHA
jgi:hypothetical protein